MNPTVGEERWEWVQVGDGDRVAQHTCGFCFYPPEDGSPLSCPVCQLAESEAERDRLRELAEWLVALDACDSTDRRAVTLTQIIDRARAFADTEGER